ncbi:MAG: glycosyltransferase family 9 protein [Candidatus Omnitrophica bacterium]|nr:glycosyltransferase family 9 protein [Candidatus Omnitrophota bacterium]
MNAKNEFKNILIVRTDRIGDVVLTTPSIRAVKKHFPNARVTVLLSPATTDLLKGLDFIDEILVDDRKNLHRGWRGYLSLITMLRQKKFDLAVIYHTKRRTNLACFLANIPRRLGYKNNKYGFLLNNPAEDTRHEGLKHETQYCLDLLSKIGIQSNNSSCEVARHANSDQWIKDFLVSKGIQTSDHLIVLHLSASDPARQWPKENFANLISELSKKYSQSKFIIIGTKESQPLAADIQNMTKAEIIDTTGLITLSQMVSLLAQVQLLISNDSGPVHVAVALGTPVVSIFTRNQPGINPQRWQPLGKNSRFVSVPFNDQISFKKNRAYDPKTMGSITVGQVLEAVDSLY